MNFVLPNCYFCHGCSFFSIFLRCYIMYSYIRQFFSSIVIGCSYFTNNLFVINIINTDPSDAGIWIVSGGNVAEFDDSSRRSGWNIEQIYPKTTAKHPGNYMDLDTKKIQAKIFGELWNVVLEENGEDKIVGE